MAASKSVMSGVAVTHLCLLVSSANAQSAFQFRPSFSLTQMHDSNLFSTPTNVREDFITRLTPTVDSDYRSTRLRLAGHYSLDAEAFAEHTDLTNALTRQQTSLTAGYDPTSRLSFTTGAEYLTTQTPGELNADTSLSFTRAPANRFAAHSQLTRKLSARSSMTAGYTFTQDRLASQFESKTHTAHLGVERRRSSRTAIRLSYRFRGFSFASDGLDGSPVDSHALSFGWMRALARQISVRLDGGPRVTNGEIRPELNTSVEAHFRAVDWSLGYGRTQNTVIGVVGTADVQHVAAGAAWRIGRSLQMHVAPAYFRNALNDRAADVYTVRIGVERSITRMLSVDVAVDASRQVGHLVPVMAGDRIDRSGISIRFVTGPTAREE